jgi:hypothetical protein
MTHDSIHINDVEYIFVNSLSYSLFCVRGESYGRLL